MVAYSFKKRFAPAIETGLKTHTMRAARRRHARVGEQLQLYTGMRTKHCRLIGTARCDRFRGVLLKFSTYSEFSFFEVVETDPGQFKRHGPRRSLGDPDAFAQSDGFADMEDMARFWRDEHGVTRWEGFLIGWTDFTAFRKFAA
jgi:hypothetical protein